jgi:hypothetical protein
MESDWYRIGWLLWSNKAAREFFWVPKGHKWARWQGRKPTAWHLMPHNKHLGKQGCNCQFRNHKIFNPCKNRSVNFYPSFLFRCNCIHIVICCQLIIRNFTCCYLLVHLLFHIVSLCCFKLVLLLFVLLFCLSDYSISDYWVLSLSWSWKCVPGILISITTTIQQVNKHHNTRPAPPFVLV